MNQPTITLFTSGTVVDAKNAGSYVRLEDYKKLQAELERLSNKKTTFVTNDD